MIGARIGTLKDGIESKAQARTAVYSQFSRQLKANTAMKSQYQACSIDAERKQFRTDWAANKLQVLETRMKQTSSLCTVDMSQGTFRTIEKIAQVECTTVERATGYARMCIGLGEKFVMWDPMWQVHKFLHFEHSIQEKLTRAWEVQQVMEQDNTNTSAMQHSPDAITKTGTPTKREAEEEASGSKASGKKAKAKSKHNHPPEENTEHAAQDNKAAKTAEQGIKKVFSRYKDVTGSTDAVLKAVHSLQAWSWLRDPNPMYARPCWQRSKKKRPASSNA